MINPSVLEVFVNTGQQRIISSVLWTFLNTIYLMKIYEKYRILRSDLANSLNPNAHIGFTFPQVFSDLIYSSKTIAVVKYFNIFPWFRLTAKYKLTNWLWIMLNNHRETFENKVDTRFLNKIGFVLIFGCSPNSNQNVFPNFY